MKRIAFVINALQSGGAERVLGNLTKGLPEDWDVDIILADARRIAYEYRGNIIDLGVSYDENKNSLLFFLKVFMKRLVVLTKLKKNNHYLVCIGFMDSANIVNILTGNKYCRTISSVHSNLTEAKSLPEYKYIVNPLVKLLYNKSDSIVAVSAGIGQDLIQHYGIHPYKVHTIYNGCELSKIRVAQQEKLEVGEQKWFESNYVVVTMGRLDTPKAQWHLIRAFKRVIDTIPEAKLLILGEGQHKDYLMKLVKELKIEDNIIFCGYCSNPFKILAKCHLFAFSSVYEGLPTAIIEAMYCGLPVVSTDFNSGAREILAPNTPIGYQVQDKIECAEYGILLPVCDGIRYQAEDTLTKEEQYLAKAMVMMYDNYSLRDSYSKKAIERAEEFDAKKMVCEWLQLIETINC